MSCNCNSNCCRSQNCRGGNSNSCPIQTLLNNVRCNNHNSNQNGQSGIQALVDSAHFTTGYSGKLCVNRCLEFGN